MTAKTGHEKTDRLVLQGELADLFGQALGLIRDGKRTDPQTAQLRRALQLFKENNLSRVISGSESMSKDNLQDVLSIKLSDVLSKRHATYCKDLGILFVGELYVAHFWNSPLWNNEKPDGKTQVAQACANLLRSLDLPFDLNLDDAEWIPPYANDGSFLAGICQTHQRHGETFTLGSEMRHLFKLGSWFRSKTSKASTALSTARLRAGMYIPPQLAEQIS